jgi:type IV pilus assembly protein PilB
MATPTTATRLTGLALRLVRDKVLTTEDAERIQEEAVRERKSFVTHAVETKKVDSKIIAQIASEEFGVPLLDINALDIEAAPTSLIGEKIIRRHRVLPIYKRGSRLYVATSDPTNVVALDEIKFATQSIAEPVLVEDEKLGVAIEKFLEANDTTFSNLADEEGLDGLEDLEVGVDEDTDKGADDAAGVNDTPIVKFVNKVLLDAINKGASDIHIEPYEKSCRVRFRIDGVLQEVAAPPLALAGRIAARIKILSKLDIAERRIPQDGRIKMRLSRNRAIDFRVSTLPTLFGEKIVLRILDPTSATFGVEKLGFEPDQKDLFLDAVHRPYGMVLVTGPTGSGKTVTLYTAVNILNSPERNISTAEDPVEINLAGINQVNINDKQGLDFASALRSFLRQDPDIILVGEIRDLETASIAIKAAQTGHMVLSTLHTNSAPATLSRLVNMGVPPFNIASAVNLIVAQRLARRLCEKCKRPIDLPNEALLKAGFQEEQIASGIKVWGPVGCDACNGGYKGRVGIYEVMPVSEAIGEIIMRDGTELDIEQQMRKDGVYDLRTAGLKKVLAGLTSLEEVERVTNQ